MCLLALAIVVSVPTHAADQHWIRVSSDRFAVLTDANEKSGHDTVARLEQMRAVFGTVLMRNKLKMSQPIDIIALANDQEYSQLAPPNTTKPAFWLSGEDRIFIVLNLSKPDNWRPVEYQFARYLLDYNYPPTPLWFDEGLAEYFASLNFTLKNVELGVDPASNLDSPANGAQEHSFVEALKNPAWMPWTELLNARSVGANPLFRAQSWILVHYLLATDKMSEAGVYFNLVENQRAPVDQAVQQAFGMSIAQLDHEVKNYFLSAAPVISALAAPSTSKTSNTPALVTQSALPFPLEEVGTSRKDVSLPEAQALVDEMELRIPERRQQAFDRLQALSEGEKTDTVVAHRALAWAYVQKHETNHAFEELNEAVKLNANDPWTRFGLALASYHSGQEGARIQGLANMMESLHIVIAEFPNFAQAYNMLGWARLAGGGPNAAIESLKVAVQLSPRNEDYELLLARAYLAGKKFKDASSILDRLKLSQNSQIAQAASKELVDLPFLEKYGVPPVEQAQKQQPAAAPKNESSDNSASDDDGDQKPAPKPVSTEPKIDKRPVKFLKGTLVSVDCSKTPAAVISVSQAGKVLKLRAADYKSVAVIGAPEFSCTWKGIPVNVNYRASGASTGDLLSIELH
jgi:thioredoxin-like negative regulator of GroEL